MDAAIQAESDAYVPPRLYGGGFANAYGVDGER
jgi:hypothetical protein